MDLTSSNCTDPDCDGVCLNKIFSAHPMDKKLLENADVKLNFSILALIYENEDLYKPNTYKHFFVVSPSITAADALNNISSSLPPVPLLSQLHDVPENTFCNAHDLPHNFGAALVRHPFHLHGFAYYVAGSGQPLSPTTNESTQMTLDYFKQLDNNNEISRNADYPPRKDTLAVPNNGYTIFRFRANNPGFWLFHCHIIFHNVGGTEVIFQVGEVNDMPKTPKHFPKCGNYKPEIINERKEMKYLL